MTWFRRGHDSPPAALGQQDDAQDTPAALGERLGALVRFVNRSAGRLPIEAVVVAGQIADTIRDVIATSGDGELDVYAVVTIKGIVDDYLPTTLQAYLALDPSLLERADPAGRSPRAALHEQLDSLRSAAAELLAATRSHDVDALFTQGNFLRTKFTGSDLDL